MISGTSTGADRAYYAQRAAEELELALAASDAEAAAIHRQLQRAYLERASVGDRDSSAFDPVG
jgi:hypothetical protein